MANGNQTIGDDSHTSSVSSTQGETPAFAQVSTSPEPADSSSPSSFSSADIPMMNASAQTQGSSPPPQYLDNSEGSTSPINTATEVATTAPASPPALFADTDISTNDVVGTVTVTSSITTILTTRQRRLTPRPSFETTTSIISIIRPSSASIESQRLAAYYDARARQFRTHRRRLAVQRREARHRRRGALADVMSEEREEQELYNSLVAQYRDLTGIDVGLGEVIELSGRDTLEPEGWI